MNSTKLTSSFFSKSIFKDIRFWIFLFAIIRLYGIHNPPLEIAHNWRQTTVAMVARNFLETDSNIFYPRIDIAGEKTGITGMEFPLFNYLIYLVSLVFGYTHWAGRLINLIVSSFGIFFFYKLIKKYFNPDLAFNASIILLVSFWFSYSRKIMPDTFASSLVIVSLYFGSNYLDKNTSLKNLLLYFIFGSLGILSKLPVAYIWSIFLIFFINSEISIKRKMVFTAISISMFSLVYWWYFIWVPFLVGKYEFWHFFMGKPLSEGIAESYEFLGRILNHFYESSLRYAAFTFFTIGLFFSFIKKQKVIASVFIIGLVAFSMIVLKSGKTFAFHSYYVIPFIPIMALVAAYGLQQLKNKKIVIAILVVISLEGILNQWNDFVIKPNEKVMLRLEHDLDSFSRRDDLFVINSGYYPTPMYFAHRKGWVSPNDKLQNDKYLENLKTKDCKYILILKKSFGTNMNIEAPISFENEDYKVYSLE